MSPTINSGHKKILSSTNSPNTEDKIISIPYSLRNKYTNIRLPISILNPLISSLSPSIRSNGARFLSIKDNKNHKDIQTASLSKEAALFMRRLNRLEKTTINSNINATS